MLYARNQVVLRIFARPVELFLELAVQFPRVHEVLLFLRLYFGPGKVQPGVQLFELYFQVEVLLDQLLRALRLSELMIHSGCQ